MADNVAITAGSGTTVGTDELTINATAVQVQRVKLVAGKDGTYVGDVTGPAITAGGAAVFTAPVPATTGTVTSPGSITTSTATVLASNTGRLGATIYCESGATAYVKLGATASLTSYTVQIEVGGYYQVPFGYTGVIDGITSSGTAVLRVTELTA